MSVWYHIKKVRPDLFIELIGPLSFSAKGSHLRAYLGALSWVLEAKQDGA